MRPALLLSVFLFASSGDVLAQELREHPDVEAAVHLLERWIDAERAYSEIPGLSIAVVMDQDVLWSGASGVADLDTKTPATSQTVYSICSVSKLFTSIGVMQLQDQGRVDLHTPVSEALPWFSIQQSHPDGPPVTVEGLLTHSAGLPRESDFPYWSAPDFSFPEREAIVDRLSEQETLYPASRYFQYSNLGLTLAGEIIAEASGEPFEAYVQNHILDPLGLDHTAPQLPWDQMATGYTAMTRRGVRDRVPPFEAAGITPAAGFSSTVEDLARFASWQFRLLDGDESDGVLRENTLREMQRVHWLDPDWDVAWGLGFSVQRRGDHTFVGHGGSCPGFRTSFMVQPDTKTAVVVMANANGVNVCRIAAQAFEILSPALKKAKADSSASSEPLGEIDRFTGTYSLSPWGGEVEVLRWEDGLAMVALPTDNPVEALSRLKHIEGATFRRIRDDDELGETVVFEMDPEGTVTGLRQHSNVYPRLQ